MPLYADIEKNLGSFHLKVKLEAENETLALLGASGCGKSMTLKCIAGIVRPDRGRIVLNGVTLFDSEKHIDMTPQKRRTGLLFQNYALFPNMTVIQNIRCGAKREHDRTTREKRLGDILDSFGLAPLSDRYPAQLSGGQQQRVALARILVSDPEILLLDEPFSALDSHLRFRLEQEVKQIITDFGKTTLLVSHDRDEVYRLSDRIAVMSEGHIDAVGGKKDVFADPHTRTGAALTGCKNISSVRVTGENTLYASDWGISLRVPKTTGVTAVGVRMHDISHGDGENAVTCRVTGVTENPFSYVIMLAPIEGKGTAPLGWEIEKPFWNTIQAETLTVHLPEEKLLLLED